MIFKKLELKNFKSHVDTTIDFNVGTTLIIGKNGAGKSSIFEAITFALFKGSKSNMGDLVKTTGDPSKRVNMEVKLTFESDGNTYRVERIVTKKNNNASSKEDNLIRINNENEERFVEGATEVNNEIRHILNMNSTTFTNAIHIKQGEISELVDKTSAERDALISQLLRLDDLEKAYKEMPKIIDIFKIKKAGIESKIVPEEELDSKLHELIEEQNSQVRETADFRNNLDELNKEFELKSNEKDKLDEQEKKLETLKLKLENEEKLLEKLNILKEDLTNKFNEIRRNEAEMIELKPFTEKLQAYNEFKKYFYKFNQIKNDIKSKNEILEKIKIHKKILSTEKENHDRYLELKQELERLNGQQIRLSSEVDTMEEVKNNLEMFENKRNEYSESLKIAYNNCKNILMNHGLENIDLDSTTLEKLEEQIERLEMNIKNEITQIDAKINESNNNIGSLKQKIRSSNKSLEEITKVEGKCPTCNSNISPTKKNQLMNEYETTISDSKNEINQLNELIDSLNGDKSLQNDNLNELESAKNIIKTHKHIPEQINDISKNIEKNETKVDELKVKQETLNELKVSIKSKTDEFKDIETNYNSYIQSETILNNLEDEEKLKRNIHDFSVHIDEIKFELNRLIEHNPNLSLEIREEDLNNKIEKLTEKNNKYNTLKGSVKDKREYEIKIYENEKEIDFKENEINMIKRSIEKCDYDGENHEYIKKSVKEIGDNMSQLDTKISVNQANITNRQEKIKELTLEIEENKKYISKLDSIKDYMDILTDFRDHYGKNGIQRDLRLQSRPLIQKYAREFFEKFNFNYSGLKITDDYDISVFGPKGEANIKMISGGEKIAIALSLRLAITSVMSEGNIDTILLDEPTIHLDNERRNNLINVLQSMTVIPQMIIVTHDKELRSAAEEIIKIEKIDGDSKIINDD